MTAKPLQDFVSDVVGDYAQRVEDDLGSGFVRLSSSEAERRQAAHDIRSSEDIILELLRNSRDAGAKRIYVATQKSGIKRSIIVIDDGCGIPESHHSLIFEPRVTSKLNTVHFDTWGVHGRGMALYALKTNAETAKIVASSPQRGCVIKVETNLTKISERKDQSSYPILDRNKNQTIHVRGPKNIVRTTFEFALAHKNEMKVCIGSPIEIAAAMYSDAQNLIAANERIFGTAGNTHPLCDTLAFSQDSAEFAQSAQALGLEMSERSARRILNREIEPAPHILHILSTLSVVSPLKSKSLAERKKKQSSPDYSSPVLSQEDTDFLIQSSLKAYQAIAPSYYLSTQVRPRLTIQNGSLHISIPLLDQSENSSAFT